MNPKVSIIIPAYKDVELLPNLLDKLLKNDYVEKEIIVIFDEPTPESLKAISKYNNHIRLIINKERKGKVYALNIGGKLATGDLLLFFDNDVTINRCDFLRRVVEEMDGYDIGEILKVIIRDRSLISRMVFYDYLASMYGNYLFYKFLGRCVGFNGAAVVMTKQTFRDLNGFRCVTAEDLDFGIRTFIKNKRFKFIKSIRAGFWIKEYGKDLLSITKQNAKIILPVLLTLFPSFIPLALVFLLNNSYIENILFLLLLTISSRINFLIPVTVFTSYYLSFIKTLISTLTSMVIFSIYFYYISRKINVIFSPVEFMIYYLFYSPVWLIILLTGILKAFISKKIMLDDWKLPDDPLFRLCQKEKLKSSSTKKQIITIGNGGGGLF